MLPDAVVLRDIIRIETIRESYGWCRDDWGDNSHPHRECCRIISSRSRRVRSPDHSDRIVSCTALEGHATPDKLLYEPRSWSPHRLRESSAIPLVADVS
jgi:hypothetical protein